MSKSQLYQHLQRENSNELLDFLISKNIWSSPELNLSITIKFDVNGEQIEFPLYQNMPQQQITVILEKLELQYSEFEEFRSGL